MKLLYFGNERLDAQNLATSLREISRNGTVSWTRSAERASAWMAQNRDVAALVVETQTDEASWQSLLTCAHGLSPRPVVIAVMPEGTAAPTSASRADHYIERNSPQFRDLAAVVTHLVAGAHASQEAPSSTVSVDADSARLVDLERQLAAATAALQDAEERHAAAMTAAANQLAERQLQYEFATAGATARWAVVDEQLRTATMEAATAQQNYLSAAARLDRLTQRESELSSQLAATATKNDALERRLVEADAAMKGATTRATQELLDAAGQFAERQRELQSSLDAEVSRRAAVEAELAQTVRAREDAEIRHDAAVADFEARLFELETALGASRHDHESSVADVERLSAREEELDSALADVRASHGNLERRLAATEAAFRDADERATLERLAATRKAAAREAELDGQIRDEREARADVERLMDQAEAVRVETLKRHEAALAAAAAELAEHQARFDRDRSQAAADRDRLIERVREVEDALAPVERELAAVIKDAIARRAELDDQIRQERAVCANLERELTEAEAAWGGSQQQYEAALADAAHLLAEHRTRSDRELMQTAADRDRLSERVREVEGVLAQARTDHQSATDEVARLTQCEGDLSARLAAVATELGDMKAARQTAEGQLAEAIQNATAREAELDGQIRQEQRGRADLQRALSEAEAGRALIDLELSQTAAARDRLNGRMGEVEGALARLTEREGDLSAQLAEIAAAREAVEHQLADAIRTAAAREAELVGQVRQEQGGRADLERALTVRVREVESALATAERQLAEAVRAHEEARNGAAACQADLEARLTREIEARHTLERTIAETRAAAVDAERASKEQTEALRADAREQQERFDARLQGARTDHQKLQAELQAGNAALARERDGLGQSLAAAQEQSRQLDADSRRLTAGLAESERRLAETRTEIQQLQERLAATVGNLDGTTARLNAVQAQAEIVPRLRRELEESRAESGRLFQQAGLAMFRCTRNGEVTQANRAAMTLVGRRTIDELRGAQFSAGVFEDPNGLSWLIDLCVSTRTRESIETTWRRKDGSRLFVRLSAYACAPDVIEILAEDLTRVRVLQERLGQAQRIEAVGRLASEVAATCGSLLNDVHQQVQEWLIMPAGSRPQAQQLLADVTRAAGLLGQLRAYEEEQSRNPTLADLNTVIHDLEPVLKRLAGDAVDVQLPGGASRLNVDVSTERVERLLVNLASYGRARMPFGGQLKIELGTTVVDRRFAAKHPNVRLGPHALITVTETKSSRHADGTSSSDSTDQKPGVDFGTLHGLVGGCGGHLWMTVQPQGDMIAKIRLPLLASHDDVAPRKLIARGGRALTRLFHL